MVNPCSCPRQAHRTCLARWQLTCVGGRCGIEISKGKRQLTNFNGRNSTVRVWCSEEVQCRFCAASLPDWRLSLAERPRATPVMTIMHRDQVHAFRVLCLSPPAVSIVAFLPASEDWHDCQTCYQNSYYRLKIHQIAHHSKASESRT